MSSWIITNNYTFPRHNRTLNCHGPIHSCTKLFKPKKFLGLNIFYLQGDPAICMHEQIGQGIWDILSCKINVKNTPNYYRHKGSQNPFPISCYILYEEIGQEIWDTTYIHTYIQIVHLFRLALIWHSKAVCYEGLIFSGVGLKRRAGARGCRGGGENMIMFCN